MSLCIETTSIAGCHTDIDGNLKPVIILIRDDGKGQPATYIMDVMGQVVEGADATNTIPGACVEQCAPVCFEGVVTEPWFSCLVETCYSRATVTPGEPSGPNGSFVVEAGGTIPIQDCSLSMYGTPEGSTPLPAPWFTVGTIESIRDDNGICPNEVGMVRMDAGDTLGVTFDLNEGAIYRANVIFRKIEADNLGPGSMQIRMTGPNGFEQIFGPRQTTRAGGNAGWDRFGTDVLGNDSLVTAPETGTYTLTFESLGPAPIRAIEMAVQVFDNSGEVTEPVTTVDYFRSETVGDVTTWFDQAGNVIAAPSGDLVEIACPSPPIE